MNAAKLKQVESQWVKRDVRIKSWKAREIQLEVSVCAKRECLSKLVARLEHDRTNDDAEDERNEEDLCDCFFPQYIASPGVSPLMRRTEREVRRDSCDKVHIVFTDGDDIHVLLPLFHSRQLDDGWCKPVRESCLTVAGGQFLRSKAVCSQTLVNRNSSKNSSFALDA